MYAYMRIYNFPHLLGLVIACVLPKDSLANGPILIKLGMEIFLTPRNVLMVLGRGCIHKCTWNILH